MHKYCGAGWAMRAEMLLLSFHLFSITFDTKLPNYYDTKRHYYFGVVRSLPDSMHVLNVNGIV